ncbi:MAG TPA: DUF3417 domain-containing protein, partial [Pseudonocardiaceae bacterium]|nr:DUF3417 domain-containing protein [Pseudonocardiaceae bacterium]
MRAVRRLTVPASLPERLAALDTLARNLRWTWHPATRDLFAEVDGSLWAATGDPLRVLTDVSAERLADLAANEGFVGRCRALADDLAAYLTGDRW